MRCFCECDCDKKWVVWMSMILFIWCDYDAFVFATSHMEPVLYLFCGVCDSNIYQYRSQSHCVNKQPQITRKNCQKTLMLMDSIIVIEITCKKTFLSFLQKILWYPKDRRVADPGFNRRRQDLKSRQIAYLIENKNAFQ